MARFGTVLVALSLFASPTLAQDGWLDDVNVARQRAKSTNRPLIIDFGTANCVWCKKLDQTTFRDPSIARRLAERFVAVRIDADKEAALAQQLGISSYPTLVFASPDGKILGKHAGYVDVARFEKQLDRLLQESVPASQEVAVRPAATTPDDRPTSTPLARLRLDYEGRRYLACLERCKELNSGPDAVDAQRIADDIKTDPEKSRLVQAALVETLGDLYLASADAAMRQGRWQDAKAFLDRTQQMCPASPQALAAKHQELQLRSKMPAEPIFRMQAP